MKCIKCGNELHPDDFWIYSIVDLHNIIVAVNCMECDYTAYKKINWDNFVEIKNINKL